MPAEMLIINPVKKSRRHKRRRPMTAKQRQYFGGGKKSGGRKRRRSKVVSLARNPMRRTMSAGSLKGIMGNTIVPAAIGGLGGIAMDYVLTQASPYLPASLTTGMAVPVVRLGAAVLLGMAASAVAGKAFGRDVAIGAATITAYGLARQYMTPTPAAASTGVSRYAGQMGAMPRQMRGYTGAGASAAGPRAAATLGGLSGRGNGMSVGMYSGRSR